METPNPKCGTCKCYWKPDETDIKPSGLQYKTCKKCRENGKKYYEENPDKIKEQSKKYKEENADKIKQNMKKYYVEEMDLICENWEKNIPKKINDLTKNNNRGFIDFSVLNKNLDI